MTTPTEARALIAKLQDVWPGDDPVIDALRSLADQVEAIQKERDTLRELVREALHPVSHDWRKYWNERAEKALTPQT